MFDYYIENSSANIGQLGGVGRTVEIDESKFGHRKNYRGRLVEGCWVFGGIERESGNVFLEVVKNGILFQRRSCNRNKHVFCKINLNYSDAKTLIPLIKKYIADGTTIISDCWAAYRQLDELEFDHLTVNHSVNFKDPETGANTNRIECTWRHAKESMGTQNRKKAHMPGNLARYIFMKSMRIRKIDFAVGFYKLAGDLYDPRKNPRPILEENYDDEEIDLFNDKTV